MTSDNELLGHRILLVEDDFLLAMHTARALRFAGAEVLGPCRTEAAARGQIGESTPTAALVDVNLGRGPSFELARALVARSIPLIFVTGYEASIFPPEFADLPRLQKPVQLASLLGLLKQTARNPAAIVSHDKAAR